jgi:hypothetical protein
VLSPVGPFFGVGGGRSRSRPFDDACWVRRGLSGDVGGPGDRATELRRACL